MSNYFLAYSTYQTDVQEILPILCSGYNVKIDPRNTELLTVVSFSFKIDSFSFVYVYFLLL